MRATREATLYWMEETFPEDVQLYTQLCQHMAGEGIRTLIADGGNLLNEEIYKEKYRRAETVIS